MTNLFLGFGVVTVLTIAIVLLRKRKISSKLNKSDSKNLESQSAVSKNNKPQADRATLSLDEKDQSIRPEGYQQRNLDREVGGLEEGKKGLKESDEIEEHTEDAWDKRSDEVDKVGSIDPLAGDDKESMTWRLKKIRLGIGKHLVHDHDHDKQAEGTGKHFDSRYAQGGFSQIVKARQDFGQENDGGGMSR